MLECHQIQDDLRNGRRLPEQGSLQDVCCEILARRYSCQPAGPRHFCQFSFAERVILAYPHLAHQIPNIRPEVCARSRHQVCRSGIAFNLSTLIQHRWSTSVNWSEAIGKTDLLSMYQKRETLPSTLDAMGLEVQLHAFAH